jgi:hypothetical protein
VRRRRAGRRDGDREAELSVSRKSRRPLFRNDYII